MKNQRITVFKRLQKILPIDGLPVKSLGQVLILVACVLLLNSKIAHTQIVFTPQTAGNNPLNGLISGVTATAPYFVDWDGDGDLDLAVSELNGSVKYFENTGVGGFVERTVGDNPFNGLNVGYAPSIVLVDIDGDNDHDLISGEGGGTIKYFENTGLGGLQERTGAGVNPFHGIQVGSLARPAIVDLNGDTHLDLVIGNGDGNLTFYSNNGSNVFTLDQQVNYNLSNNAAPALADIDYDGDLDIVVGELNGGFAYVQRTGDTLYIARQGDANPFGGLTYNVGSFSTPTFVDLDGDGDTDMVSGSQAGDLYFYENKSPRPIPSFVQMGGSGFPFDAIRGDHIAPLVIDMDGDGDTDLIIGTEDNGLRYFLNTGSNTYVEQTGPNNPFEGLDFTDPRGTGGVGSSVAPAMTDCDGDGDLDLLVGGTIVKFNFGTGATTTYGALHYFENTGGNTFVKQTGVSNPFDAFGITSERPRPAFGDLNGDGSDDLIWGEADGSIDYYERTGLATFAAPSTGQNPFDGGHFGINAAPTFTDLDQDGDLDILIGGLSNTTGLDFLENRSNGSPLFLARTGQANPFKDIDQINTVPFLTDLNTDGTLDLIVGIDSAIIYYKGSPKLKTPFPSFNIATGLDNPFSSSTYATSRSTPAFADLDGDGALDLIVGNGFDGTIKHYKKENAPVGSGFVYAEQSGLQNSFDGQNGGIGASPAYGYASDDFIVGTKDGDFKYFQTASLGNPRTYNEETGPNNPLDGIDIGDEAKPTFVDLDLDGDMDMVAGTAAGTLAFFLRDNNNLTLQAAVNNPFDGLVLYLANGQTTSESYLAPTFGDLDLDGDPDLILGTASGTYYLLENTGSKFIQVIGDDNPLRHFGKSESHTFTNPTLTDVDVDGDLDLVAGRLSGHLSYYINGDAVTVSPPLPVEFLHFKGHAVAQGNALQWATATEDNNEGFYVQRSSDGRRFDNIEWVAGAGTTQEVQSYAFLDREPLAGVNYYRLKQVDYDGTFAYSKVISLYQQATAGEGEPFAYPNPTRDFLTIEAPTASLATLFNALGQPLKQIPLTGATRTLDVSDLPKGLYALQLQAADGTILRTQQVVKL